MCSSICHRLLQSYHETSTDIMKGKDFLHLNIGKHPPKSPINENFAAVFNKYFMTLIHRIEFFEYYESYNIATII